DSGRSAAGIFLRQWIQRAWRDARSGNGENSFRPDSFGKDRFDRRVVTEPGAVCRGADDSRIGGVVEYRVASTEYRATMTIQEHNYWLATVEMPRGNGSELPESVDVAVLGAGFTGLSAARALARQTARVAVIEAESIGWGASSRNGGMVLTGLKLGVNKLISMYGRERTQRMYAASLDSINAVEQIVKDEGIDCDFSRCGHLEVACKQKHFDDYARQVEVIAREFNHQLRIVP